MPLSNNYSLKTAKDQRPCFICGKFSSSVLDAPDDFFFVCSSHTKDSGFCSVVTETQTATKTTVNEEESEIELLKKEISGLKGQLNKSESKEIETDADAKKPEEQKTTIVPAKAVYKLHRSILYLREQEKLKKENLNLLKSLK